MPDAFPVAQRTISIPVTLKFGYLIEINDYF